MEKQCKAKVSLDTNMLLAVNELKLDVFEEIKRKLGKVDFLIAGRVLNEMNELKKEGKKKEKGVLIAEKLIKINKCKILKEGKENNADEELIELSGKGVMIGTNDKELKKKIKEKGGRVIFIRQKKIIQIE
ncbi:MAG: hypothetical protein ABIE23_00155 [archaeon]|nr:hypothetical protein [Candidatus Micrarchaeota archaeon]